MSTFFGVLLSISCILFLVALVKPDAFKNNKTGEIPAKKTLLKGFAVLIFLFFILTMAFTPESEKKETLSDESRKQAKPYEIIIKSEANIPGRKRLEICILSPEAKTFDELASTAIKAAKDYQDETGADVVTVFLDMCKETVQTARPLAIARYAPDGKGYNSDSWVWQVEAVPEYPSEMQIKITALYESNKERFKKADGMYDQDKINSFIARELKIKESDVLFFYPSRQKYEGKF